jgi:hypothetical protein
MFKLHYQHLFVCWRWIYCSKRLCRYAHMLQLHQCCLGYFIMHGYLCTCCLHVCQHVSAFSICGVIVGNVVAYFSLVLMSFACTCVRSTVFDTHAQLQCMLNGFQFGNLHWMFPRIHFERRELLLLSLSVSFSVSVSFAISHALFFAIWFRSFQHAWIFLGSVRRGRVVIVCAHQDRM